MQAHRHELLVAPVAFPRHRSSRWSPGRRVAPWTMARHGGLSVPMTPADVLRRVFFGSGVAVILRICSRRSFQEPVF